MARRTVPAIEARKQRRRMTLLWSLVTAIVVITLIYKEQVAILYILATVSVAVLLFVVAKADLAGAHNVSGQMAPMDDAAAIGSNLTTSPSTTFGSTAPRTKGR